MVSKARYKSNTQSKAVRNIPNRQDLAECRKNVIFYMQTSDYVIFMWRYFNVDCIHVRQVK